MGLFVDPTPETIAATLDTVRLDILQLYGTLDLPALRARFGLPIWHPVAVASAADLPAAAERGRPSVGGSKTAAWCDAARRQRGALRLVAAARLARARTVDSGRRPDGGQRRGGYPGHRASAVDVSSGVERERGVKDPALIRAFIANARSNGIQFRPATPADAEALGHAHVTAWREAYVGLIPDAVLVSLDPRQRAAMWHDALTKGAIVQLAERDGAIVGFGSSGPPRDPTLPCAGEIHAVYVLRSAQRQGVGRTLMAAMARELLARGHASAGLWVLEGNTSARRFYEALGGREIERREQQREGFSSVGIAYGWEDLTPLT